MGETVSPTSQQELQFVLMKLKNKIPTISMRIHTIECTKENANVELELDCFDFVDDQIDSIFSALLRIFTASPYNLSIGCCRFDQVPSKSFGPFLSRRSTISTS
jgi:hypothetical protein